jgi:hypothetical protein
MLRVRHQVSIEKHRDDTPGEIRSFWLPICHPYGIACSMICNYTASVGNYRGLKDARKHFNSV